MQNVNRLLVRTANSVLDETISWLGQMDFHFVYGCTIQDVHIRTKHKEVYPKVSIWNIALRPSLARPLQTSAP